MKSNGFEKLILLLPSNSYFEDYPGSFSNTMYIEKIALLKIEVPDIKVSPLERIGAVEENFAFAWDFV